MKTIIMHIGTDKTGTTSLQNFLTLNHQLLKEYDIFYPVDPTKKYNYFNQHGSLVPSIKKENFHSIREEKSFPNGEALDEFLEDIRHIKEEKILISSESFFGALTPIELEKLKHKLIDYKIVIIIYLRRQDDYYLSGYQQGCKVGGTYNLPSVQDAKTKRALSYYEGLSKWAKVFGKENVLVRVFERKQFYKNDLYADFLKLLGIELNDLYVIPTNQNISISLEKTYFLHKLSQYTVRLTDASNKKRWLHQDLREMIINEQDFLNKGKVKDILSYDDRIEILKYFEEGNRKIAVEFLGRKDGILFTVPSKEDYSDRSNKITSDFDEIFIKNLGLLVENLFTKVEDYKVVYDKFLKAKLKDKIDNKRLKLEYEFIKNQDLFDQEFYLKLYTDVRKAGVDPIMHYLKYGWLEGRNPSKNFNTKEYILKNIELLDENINPLIHYYQNIKNK